MNNHVIYRPIGADACLVPASDIFDIKGILGTNRLRSCELRDGVILFYTPDYNQYNSSLNALKIQNIYGDVVVAAIDTETVSVLPLTRREIRRYIK